MPDQSSSQNFSRNSQALSRGDHAGHLPQGFELDCTSFESHVQELLDLRKSPEIDLAVQMHASNCAECSDLLHQFTQLESALQLALKSKTPAATEKREVARPLHPVSRRQREQLSWTVQAAVVLLLCGALVGWVASRQPQSNSLIPVAVSELPARSTPEQLLATASGIRPAVHYRSLEQCYELTSELPGVRPLQSSIQVALAWWLDYLNLDGNETRSLPHHERGFGLNPLLAEVNRQV
jgi:hypothetical protein